ncbi:MAG: hypothetical protein OEX22_06865 [Cyclobacteriaceae bacterium]|nr:hypothetical protein [Cyclobacteriaceae bacterium]
MITRGSIIYVVVFLCCTFNAIGQSYVVPEIPDSLGTFVNEHFSRVRSEKIKDIGDAIETLWYDGSIGVDLQSKIHSHLQLMNEKGYNPSRHVSEYFASLNNAITIEALDNQKLTDYLNLLGEVIKFYNPNDALRHFIFLSNFFEYRAIFHSRGYKLYVFEDSYSFDFIAPQLSNTEVFLPDETDSQEDESYQEDSEEVYEEEDGYYDDEEDEYYDEEEEYDDEYAEEEDEYYNEEESENSDDDGWNDEIVASADPTSMVNALVEGNPPPPLEGPLIKFEKVNLNFVTGYDSVFISDTKGTFIIDKETFRGEGGRMDWSMAFLSPDSVYADFSSYHFDVKKAEIEAEKATLTYKGKLNESIEGRLNYRSARHDSSNVSYPRFLSYRNDIKINNIINEHIKFTGGFSLKGSKISSNSILGLPSTIDYIKDGTKKFSIRSKLYLFEDSTFITSHATTALYNGSDSIFHPSVRIRYDGTKDELIVLKDKGSASETPFYESFFNVNMRVGIIKWPLAKDSIINISTFGARKEMYALFESVDHFDSIDFKYMSSNYRFNPLIIVYNYYRKRGKYFLVDDLAKKYKLPIPTVSGAMKHLAQYKFIKYNQRTGEIWVTPKIALYVNSYRGTRDYDDIVIQSKIDTAANAVYNLKEKTMLVRGVKELYLSNPLDVYIEPDSSELTLLGDRSFKFNGKIIAGNFQYIGHDYTFMYDSFLIHMNVIDSVKLFISQGGGSRKKQIDNVLEGSNKIDKEEGVTTDLSGSSGVLYINRPDNKSSRKKLPNYPNFNAGTGALVRFNRKEVFNGVYGNSIYFDLPPFKIDSLNDSDPSAINFKGSFVSSGMFPVFDEELQVRDDHSLGFYHEVPSTGYQLFEGHGRLHGDIRLSKKGLRSNGKIDFLSTTVESDDFIFYPDSVTASGSFAEIRQEVHNGVNFPQATLQDYSMKWRPKQDSMYIWNNSDPFQFYDQTASLDGQAIISNNGVYGTGKMLTRGSEVNSENYSFQGDRFSARNAEFGIITENPEKPALFGDNVRLRFNLAENYADISPEVEGEAAISFPYAQFKTSITNARWDLNEQKIRMTKPENVAIENSYFYTTRKELDSLRFNATEAEYDINTQELKVTGIPYIIVADAKITPENNEVLILENSKIGTLHNTTIILDTLNGYHQLKNGVIDVISRNEFSGHATYLYVNALNETYEIDMHDFHLEDVVDSTASTGLFGNKEPQTTKHSVATGSVIEEDNVLVSPGFFFKGGMVLYAHKPALELDGYVKLDFKNSDTYDTWINYESSADQQEVSIPYEGETTQDGRRLEAGVHFSSMDNSLYSNFLEDKKGVGDDDFFTPAGNLFFSVESNEFIIEEPEKAAGEAYQGKVYAFNEATSDIRFEGPLYFFEPKNGASIVASGIGLGNVKTNEYAINSFLVFDFGIAQQAFQQMAIDFIDIVENLGAAEGLGDPTDLLYKLGDLIGDEPTKAYEKATQQEYVSLAGFAKEVTKPLSFSDVNLKWSQEFNAFYNEGKLGMSNINNYDINAAFDGFIEIKKDEAGVPIVNVFIKASADSWYYFGYEGGRLLCFSSNESFNKIISSKSNASKAKPGELVFYPGDLVETLDFINRFRNNYYGIDEPYDLGSAIEEEQEESDDGFGDTEEEATEEEDDDDDGF